MERLAQRGGGKIESLFDPFRRPLGIGFITPRPVPQSFYSRRSGLKPRSQRLALDNEVLSCRDVDELRRAAIGPEHFEQINDAGVRDTKMGFRRVL